MTPAARIATAIDLLDQILAGAPAEKALTNWARRSRFAGSGDRAAVRDHVFDALRCRRSYGWLGGADSGRGLMIGALRADGIDPAGLFTGGDYGAAPLNSEEAEIHDLAAAPLAVQLDLPDGLQDDLSASLGDRLAPVMTLMRKRAPVFLRVNRRAGSRHDAALMLDAEGIATQPHPLSETALLVTKNPRRVQNSAAFRTGKVEVQDAGSQAVVDALTLSDGDHVLDYCAGGGGKSLAMAARADLRIVAHDAEPRRMRDLAARAARAGVAIPRSATADLGAAAPFDLVLCDVPCSGSGSWRRAPDSKWRLARSRLQQLLELQSGILREAADLVAHRGRLAYVTCSLLKAENQDQIAAFLRDNPGWQMDFDRHLTPLDGGDGFYIAELSRLKKPS